MTKREAERQTHQMNTLQSLGFTREEAESLRRISMTLHSWYEKECGDSNDYKSWAIERDETTGITYLVEHMRVHARAGGPLYSNYTTYRTRIADREKGAEKRLARIIQRRDMECPENNDIRPEYALRPGKHSTDYWDQEKCLFCGQVKLTTYLQTDPRGAALYIIRPGDVPEGANVDSCYSRGICVY